MIKRNLKLDILRGVYLVEMFIDHLSMFIGKNAFLFINGFGQLWVSAAEGFVFLSGYLVGAIYYPKILNNELKRVFTRLWKRAAVLYVLGVILTLLFSVWGMTIGLFRVLPGQSRYADVPYVIINSLRYRYFYGWADIVGLYAVFLFTAPIILVMFKKKLTWLVFIISGFLWTLWRGKLDCHIGCVDIYSITSWQVLFVIGMFVGSHKDFFRNIYVKITKSMIINGLLILVFLLSIYLSYRIGTTSSPYSYIFNKPMLGYGRLALFFVWIVVGYQVIEKLFNLVVKYFGWLFITFGQNSLLTYVVQAFALYSLHIFKHKFGYFDATLITVVSIPLLWVLVCAVIYIGKRSRLLKG